MKRILLSILVIGILLLSSCGAPTTAPVAETPSTPPPIEQQTYTLNISVNPSAAGSVSPPGGEYEPGLQVTLTATPASGYTFDYWDGAASGSSLTTTITMDSNKSITAHFKVAETPSTPTPTEQPTPPEEPATPEPTVEEPSIITSKADLQKFLEENYATLNTSLGLTHFTFYVDYNDTINYPYDYWIQVEYDFNFFYDLKYSNKISTEMNNTVADELRAHQERLARAVIEKMPNIKLMGGYHYSWYTYPNIKVDLNVRRYYRWVNYAPASFLTKYEDAKITGFTWYSVLDDKLTR